MAAPLQREAISNAISDALAVLERTLATEGPQRFLAAEQRFGGRAPSSWPSLVLEGDDGPVFVDGQIDRVDLLGADAKTARVVDYKTGKLPSRDEHGKSAFQLPLYAAVAARELRTPDVEAVYVTINSRGAIDAWPKSEDDRLALGALSRDASEAARQIVRNLWQGDVAPRPSKAATCAYCDARDVCRRPVIAPVEESER
jgi:RecB family exonuclease